MQVLYVNMIISVTLGGALSFELAEAGVMKRRPRPSSEPLVSTRVVFRTAWVTTAMVASIIGIFLGTLASIWANRAGDRAILVGSTLFVTLPNFVLAPILVYIFCLQLNYLPQIWKPDRPEGDFWYLVLPVAVLAARPTALLTRLTRAKMVETMQMEFIRACVAKGVPPFRLVLRHGLRNAVLPVITAIGTSFGVLLTGSFVVETVFNLPGLGFLTIDAIRKGDMPVIQTCVLLTGAMFIFLNLSSMIINIRQMVINLIRIYFLNHLF
jgi:ABC-type dipeptide/oligopeptide/nickel transport system permease component